MIYLHDKTEVVVYSSPSSYSIVKELLVGIKEGDESAFEVFYQMEHNNILHFVSHYAVPQDQAEDIAQETLLKIWETREHLNINGNLRALAYTIARNRTLDYLRSKTDVESLDACAYLEDDSMDSQINALDLERLVRNTFAKLPEKTRNTFLFSRRDGLTNAQIAENEHVSIKAIEYRISNALRSLRKIKESF